MISVAVPVAGCNRCGGEPSAGVRTADLVRVRHLRPELSNALAAAGPQQCYSRVPGSIHSRIIEVVARLVIEASQFGGWPASSATPKAVFGVTGGVTIPDSQSFRFLRRALLELLAS